MIRTLAGPFQRRLVQNILSLYVVKGVNQLLPLAVLPFLSRVLGPTEWGRLAIAHALALWGIHVVQYGFHLSGTRAISQARERPERFGEILAGIIGAQVLLALAFGAAALVLYLAVPSLREIPVLLACGVAYAIVHAAAPLWYFIGQERMMLVASIDCAAKLSSLIAILALVEGPSDSWMVLATYGLASGLSTGLAFTLVLRETRIPRPSVHLVRSALRRGTSLGLLGIVGPGLTAGSAILLGALLPARNVAFFVAAEKLTRPLAYLLDPVNVALMPRLAHLAGTSPERARRMAGVSLVLMLATGALLALIVVAGAPWLVPLVFGPGYETAVPVARVMALLVPLIVANAALSRQWLIPHGLDRWLTCFVLASAALHLGLAFLIVPLYGALGMAWVVVGAQAFLLLGLIFALHRHALILGGPRVQSTAV